MRKLVAAAAGAFVILGTGAAHASTLHTVRSGEVLWKIGAQYQVPYQVIQRANGLTTDMIYVGQSLRIPERYVVQSGDTMWKISQRYGLPLTTLQHVNNKWDANLNVGHVLYLPTPVRSAVTLSPGDLDLFERLVWAESKGEPFAGQVAVANVVLNRVRSSEFPNTVRGVIMETYSNGTIYAFSPIANGQIHLPADQSAKDAVRVALSGGQDYSAGALFFYNSAKVSENNWIRSRSITTVIGNHTFAK